MCTCKKKEKKKKAIINSEVQVCAHKKCTNTTYLENSQSLFTLAFKKKSLFDFLFYRDGRLLSKKKTPFSCVGSAARGVNNKSLTLERADLQS